MTNEITEHLGQAPWGHGYHLPVRLAWRGPCQTAIMGTPGTTGDAGWSTVPCESRRQLEQVARDYPQARMPAWTRLGV